MAGLPPLIGYPVQIPMVAIWKNFLPPPLLHWQHHDLVIRIGLPSKVKVDTLYTQSKCTYTPVPWVCMEYIRMQWCTVDAARNPGGFSFYWVMWSPAKWLFMIQVSAIFRLWEFTSIDVQSIRRMPRQLNWTALIHGRASSTSYLEESRHTCRYNCDTDRHASSS